LFQKHKALLLVAGMSFLVPIFENTISEQYFCLKCYMEKNALWLQKFVNLFCSICFDSAKHADKAIYGLGHQYRHSQQTCHEFAERTSEIEVLNNAN